MCPAACRDPVSCSQPIKVFYGANAESPRMLWRWRADLACIWNHPPVMTSICLLPSQARFDLGRRARPTQHSCWRITRVAASLPPNRCRRTFIDFHTFSPSLLGKLLHGVSQRFLEASEQRNGRMNSPLCVFISDPRPLVLRRFLIALLSPCWPPTRPPWMGHMLEHEICWLALVGSRGNTRLEWNLLAQDILHMSTWIHFSAQNISSSTALPRSWGTGMRTVDDSRPLSALLFSDWLVPPRPSWKGVYRRSWHLISKRLGLSLLRPRHDSNEDQNKRQRRDVGFYCWGLSAVTFN